MARKRRQMFITAKAATHRLAHRPCRFELLENRHLLSAAGLEAITAQPTLSSMAVTNATPAGYTPAQVQQAYGFNQAAFSGVKGDGSGQTIAIVDAYDDPNIANDLKVFDQQFGLQDPSFTKVNLGGRTDAGWSEEIALDVEWAHAVAPGAKILLVEAKSSSVNDLLSAVDYARNQPGVTVVSMSWGSSEFVGETSYESYFTTPAGHAGVTFVVSSGDSGSVSSWPAVSPKVLAVGGTSLSISSSGIRSAETGWRYSGGAYSALEGKPSYQNSVQSGGTRSFADVAYNADPATGFAVYDSVTTGGQSGWFRIGGTSAGAPQWAGLIAIANQGRALAGRGALTNAVADLYSLPSSAFYDITSGSNGAYRAAVGYDLVTGLGSPQANLVVQQLVGLTSEAVTTVASGGTSSGFGRGGRWYGGWGGWGGGFGWNSFGWSSFGSGFLPSGGRIFVFAATAADASVEAAALPVVNTHSFLLPTAPESPASAQTAIADLSTTESDPLATPGAVDRLDSATASVTAGPFSYFLPPFAKRQASSFDSNWATADDRHEAIDSWFAQLAEPETALPLAEL